MTDKDFKIIEEYLDGNLDNNAQEAFRQRMKTDAKLSKRVKLMADMDTALADQKALDLDKKLAAIGANFFNEATTTARVVPFYRKPWAVAASFLLLIAASFTIWHLRPASFTADEIFAQHFEPGNMSEIVRGVSNKDTYTLAIQHYENGDFPEAEKLFRKAMISNPDDILAAFGLGQTCLNLEPKKLEEAARLFRKVIDHQDNFYMQEAAWYLALIQIRQGKTEMARTNLEEVKSYGGKLAEQAKTVMEKLK